MRCPAVARARLLPRAPAARGESERASRLKDDFLATLSHELRTPLNAILGWAQLLRSRPSDMKQIGDGLETIERNARAQAQIVDDLLEMSRIISGKLRLEVQPVDLASTVESSIRTVRPAADAKSIRLQPILDPRAGPISGDPARIEQILWNLLSNAIKFTPKYGQVQVVLARVNSHVELTVSDTGIGIQPDFLPFLFDRFRQADASTTRQHRGIGLGLSIVKSLVEMHGGTVSASSEGSGHGATFVVKLPLTIVRSDVETQVARLHPTSTRFAPAADQVPRLTGLRILVVDDEPDARELLKRILSDYEGTVEVAASAAEALNAIAKQPPDVLVSDIGMPDVDGYELLRAVRRLPRERGGQTPAVALTAFARSEDRQRALLSGYQSHIAKPVQAAELITVIASVAGRLRSASS
jgi:CheY-like chemotaxis protein